ncbi:hypothetical protein HaLaN_28739, partial [Haematococcus lacustris]
VLITDNIKMRHLVAEKRIVPDLVMADLLVMARATCLIHSHSGFSKTAAIWSGTPCNHELKGCQEQQWGEVSAGTSLEANLKHITVTLATWDAVWEVYLDP